MFNNILNAIQCFFDMGKELAQTQKTIIEHQAEKDIIKDKHNYKKATDIAEKIIIITQKYQQWMKPIDKRMLDKLIGQFNKYN